MTLTCVQEWTQIVRDVAATLAALTGALVAWRGLSTWKRQIKGQGDYAIAKQLLIATFRLRSAIDSFRNAMISPAETEAAIKKQGLSIAGLDAMQAIEKGTDAAYRVRFDALVAIWNEIEAGLLEANATWGEDPAKPFSDLEKCMRLLYSTIHQYLRRRVRNYPLAKIEALEAVMFDQGSEEQPDEFRQAVLKATSAVEAFLRVRMGALK